MHAGTIANTRFLTSRVPLDGGPYTFPSPPPRHEKTPEYLMHQNRVRQHNHANEHTARNDRRTNDTRGNKHDADEDRTRRPHTPRTCPREAAAPWGVRPGEAGPRGGARPASRASATAYGPTVDARPGSPHVRWAPEARAETPGAVEHQRQR